ncbi:MAG: hypothetical protein JRN15_14935 [Nitrososphaerota archaeon]|nr:hypothetical protein [Nitrososphaerota archaeon]
MLKPDQTFEERDLLNEFVISDTAVAGTLLTRDTTDTSVVGIGGCPYGHVTAGSISVASDRELGVLFYDVTATGPSFFDQVSAVLDLSSAQGQPCALWKITPGMIFSTSAFVASGTGAITAGQASGNTAPDTLLGIINGQYALVQGSGAGSIPRAKLIGNTVINGVQAIRVQVL